MVLPFLLNVEIFGQVCSVNFVSSERIALDMYSTSANGNSTGAGVKMASVENFDLKK